MEKIIPCSLKDQEVFQRVWQRVMAGREDCGCPIEAIPHGMEGDISCRRLEELVRLNAGRPAEDGAAPEESPAPEPQPEPMPPSEEAPAPEPPEAEQPPAEAEALPQPEGPHRGNDLPRLWEEPQPVDDRTARLRRQVMEALEGWQFYRHLARRARGADARVLNTLAGELHRSARRLSAAYFLITGLRYWPADDWEDPDMLELYGELGEGCQRRCRQLRALLEQDLT